MTLIPSVVEEAADLLYAAQSGRAPISPLCGERNTR